MNETELQECRKIMSQLCSNIALSMINMNMNREAIEKCREAIEYDKNNSKAT